MNPSETASTLPFLEERHLKARAAYLARDLVAYMDFFAPDLRYRQPDGRTIGRDQLMRDVAGQFHRVSAADWTFRIESVESSGTEVIETASQWGWIAATAFGILHRLWRLERQGRYTWRPSERGWQIVEVTVIREQVTGNGFQIGWKPRLPSLAEVSPKDAA